MSDQCPYCEMTRTYFDVEDECCHEYEVRRLADEAKRYKQALEAARTAFEKWASDDKPESLEKCYDIIDEALKGE